MNVLSLCSGGGGLELGIELACTTLGLSVPSLVAYCERDACAVEVLAARMADGSLAPAPIWFDLASLDGRALAGRVDLVAAGYPCQPESNAGRRAGTADERWIWPEVWRVVRDVGPGLVFLENVPGHLSGTFGRVLGDLAAGGWAAEWDCFLAATVGAPHLRDRLFVLAAHPDGARLRSERIGSEDHAHRRHHALADAISARLEVGRIEPARGGAPTAQRGRDQWAGRPPPEPAIRRVDDELARSLDGDRLHVLGNGVVPDQAAHAFTVLFHRLIEPEAT